MSRSLNILLQTSSKRLSSTLKRQVMLTYPLTCSFCSLNTHSILNIRALSSPHSTPTYSCTCSPTVHSLSLTLFLYPTQLFVPCTILLLTCFSCSSSPSWTTSCSCPSCTTSCNKKACSIIGCNLLHGTLWRVKSCIWCSNLASRKGIVSKWDETFARILQ